MIVRFFNPGLGYKSIKREMLREIDRVLFAGDLILREDVERFEQNLAEFVGTKYAVGLSNGTDALRLSMIALGIGRKDEVITVSNTFKATITTILDVGAIPVLVDIGEDYLMDMKEVARKISWRTKAIIPVHLSGDVCNMESLKLLQLQQSREDEFFIIEDACQALGGSFGPNKAGSMGKVGAFSFYPAKILGCYGDGGAITTDDRELALQLKEMRNHYKGTPGGRGGNYRLDNLQAAILNVRFKYLDKALKRREEIAQMYREYLFPYPIALPLKREGRVWQDYVIRTEARDELFAYLHKRNIETMFPPILPHKELGFNVHLPKTEEYNRQFLRLPCNAELTNKEVHYVIQAIKGFFS